MSNTAHIAKNTLALYFRQILVMLVSLYTVRAGKIAFLYQGYVGSSILRFNIKEVSFQYIEHARFCSNLVVTSKEALEGIPARITMKRPVMAAVNGKLPL
jgi:hypothetical protein